MYLIFKRVFDFFFALVVLIVTSPIIIVALILTRIESPGPIFFTQERLGYKKKIYKVLKIRTMTHKKREVHVQILKGNSEVTKVGAFLRRTKIDELPQFINVLLGDMSVVGPRPCLPTITNLFDDNTPYRFEVRPGVTSLAGVKGSIYLSWPEKWLYDRIYVEKMSLFLDFKIIINTILVVLLGEEKFLVRPNVEDLKKR